ncbi:tetratricopeptide repeat protein [Nostoc sp.]|uniref:tetratricopeptide repeat protein n=1 Tax=Nostoc sp. TaxID=1180 RepID=UPI002FF837F7
MKNPKLIILLLSLFLTTTLQLVSAQAPIQQSPKQEYVESLFLLGNAAQNAGEYLKAEIIWRKVLKIESNNAIAHNNLGITLRKRGNLEEAVIEYLEAIQINPKNANAYKNLGIAEYYIGNLEKAVDAYRKAIQINPKDTNTYKNLGIVLRKQGDLQGAVGTYYVAIQINPNDSLYYNLGLTLSDQKKLNEAIAAYKKAIKLNSKDASAYKNLDIALKSHGKQNKGIANYYEGQAISLQDYIDTPTTTQTLAHNGLGFALQQRGYLKDAIKEYKQAISLDANFVISQNNLKEAQRLLLLKQNPPPPKKIDDRQWLPNPKQEPLVGVLRSVVRIIAEIPTGNNIGAGWVVDIDRSKNTAWILTNRHVVTDAQDTKHNSEKIELEFYSHPPCDACLPRYKARIMKITEANDPLDLALLKVKDIPEDIQPLTMSSSSKAVERTTEVIVIGHPSNGTDWTTESGRISNVIPEKDQLQITATLAEGNSGGPVINKETKQVVGIMVQITGSGFERENATQNQSQPSNPATGGFGFAYDMDVVIEKLREWRINFLQKSVKQIQF